MAVGLAGLIIWQRGQASKEKEEGIYKAEFEDFRGEIMPPFFNSNDDSLVGDEKIVVVDFKVDQLERERKEAEEQERLEKAARDKVAREEQERQAALQAEAAAEQKRLEEERIEKERLDKEEERLAADAIENAARSEQARRAEEKRIKEDRIKKAEKQRLDELEAEKKRLAAQKAEQQRLAAQKAEADEKQAIKNAESQASLDAVTQFISMTLDQLEGLLPQIKKQADDAAIALEKEIKKYAHTSAIPALKEARINSIVAATFHKFLLTEIDIKKRKAVEELKKAKQRKEWEEEKKKVEKIRERNFSLEMIIELHRKLNQARKELKIASSALEICPGDLSAQDKYDKANATFDKLLAKSTAWRKENHEKAKQKGIAEGEAFCKGKTDLEMNKELAMLKRIIDQTADQWDLDEENDDFDVTHFQNNESTRTMYIRSNATFNYIKEFMEA